MIVHACDACGIAIRSGTRFEETLCGECAEQGLPIVAHTVCEACSARGVEVVRLALQHQVVRHGLPASAIDLEPVSLELGALGKLPLRFKLPAFGLETPEPRAA